MLTLEKKSNISNMFQFYYGLNSLFESAENSITLCTIASVGKGIFTSKQLAMHSVAQVTGCHYMLLVGLDPGNIQSNPRSYHPVWEIGLPINHHGICDKV